MATQPSVTFTIAGLIPAFRPEDATRYMVKLDEGVYEKGTVLGEITASPGTFAAYGNGHSDGTEVARGLLEYDCVADENGKITLSGTEGALGGEHLEQLLATTMFITGFFKTEELTGLDTAAVGDLGRIVQGTVNDGIIRLG